MFLAALQPELNDPQDGARKEALRNLTGTAAEPLPWCLP